MSAIATRQSVLLSPLTLIWLLHVALPMIGLWLLIVRPEFDLTWEDHTAHFWLVLLPPRSTSDLRSSSAKRPIDAPMRGCISCR